MYERVTHTERERERERGRGISQIDVQLESASDVGAIQSAKRLSSF